MTAPDTAATAARRRVRYMHLSVPTWVLIVLNGWTCGLLCMLIARFNLDTIGRVWFGGLALAHFSLVVEAAWTRYIGRRWRPEFEGEGATDAAC